MTAATAALATAALRRIGFFCPLGISSGSLRSGLISQPADSNRTIRLIRQPHADQELPVFGAIGQIHISMARLGKPACSLHLRATMGAEVFHPIHRCQGFLLVGIIIEHLAADAAGKLRAVETVDMPFSGPAWRRSMRCGRHRPGHRVPDGLPQCQRSP